MSIWLKIKNFLGFESKPFVEKDYLEQRLKDYCSYFTTEIERLETFIFSKEPEVPVVVEVKEPEKPNKDKMFAFIDLVLECIDTQAYLIAERENIENHIKEMTEPDEHNKLELCNYRRLKATMVRTSSDRLLIKTNILGRELVWVVDRSKKPHLETTSYIDAVAAVIMERLIDYKYANSVPDNIR